MMACVFVELFFVCSQARKSEHCDRGPIDHTIVTEMEPIEKTARLAEPDALVITSNFETTGAFLETHPVEAPEANPNAAH